MKQVVQAVGDGALRVVEVPNPTPSATDVLVATRRSLLSSGTERAVRQLASASLLQKAKARPDLVKQVTAAGPRAFVQAIVYRRGETPPQTLSELAGIPGARVRGEPPATRA